MDRHKPYGVYERVFKRPLDIICSLLALSVFCWLYAVLAILVRIKLGSPVIFKQARPGKDEKVFNLFKFRTMTDEKDENGNLLSDEPEAINILKGDMSVVGPRPLLVEYLPRYSKKQKRRHEVRPGLTGNAQVNGRNAISWEEKFDLDIEYVDRITFAGDIKIVFRTVFKSFFKQEGISSDTSATMEVFMGSSEQ